MASTVKELIQYIDAHLRWGSPLPTKSLLEIRRALLKQLDSEEPGEPRQSSVLAERTPAH